MPSLQFKGKVFVQNYHLGVPYHELIPEKDKGLSKKASLHDNLIVQGDNLKALKALLPYYQGKVKCIYIDPPYNTGNEGWAYNDAVNSPMMREWLGKEVDREDLTRHDKWCCMMMPRLRLLRELLTDDGAIFVSIDDNEVHHLRCLMDEVFGEENFVAQVTVQTNPKGRVMKSGLALSHDHILFYQRSERFQLKEIPKTSEELKKDYPDKDEHGYFRYLELRNTHREFGKFNRANLYFPLWINPTDNTVSLEPTRSHTIEVYPDWEDGFEGCWTWGSEKVSNEIHLLSGFEKKGAYKIFRKAYALDSDGNPVTKKPKTIWLEPEVQTEKGQTVLTQIFEERVFHAPKSPWLVQKLFQIATEPDSIILDSFAGSGTTAHAVLALNKEDGGNRRFVLVECEDYANTITAERVRRVIQGVPNAKDENLINGLGGAFSYFSLGKALQLQHILKGDDLPKYETLASYVFFTATGEEFAPNQIDHKSGFIGESRLFDVFLLYTEDNEAIKDLALDLDTARALPSISGKQKLVFAPTKYLDENFLDHLKITFQQLPYQIYRKVK